MTNNSNNTSIKRLLYSLFDEPIIIDGIDVSYKPSEEDLIEVKFDGVESTGPFWDLTGIFSGMDLYY